MRYSYISLLATEDYLAGILVLHHSLQRSGTAIDLLVLITYTPTNDTLSLLDEVGIHYCLADPIPSPYQQTANSPLYHMFDKLSAFGLVEYDKVVYIDSDMLVCGNIDELFARPSWSAVNTGGMLPEYAHWKQFNAGMMVIEPNLSLFNELLRQKDHLYSSDRGDQGFLHTYFPDWPERTELHLDHAYNMCSGYLARYSDLYGYALPDRIGEAVPPGKKSVKILHYWAGLKPWRRGRTYKAATELETRAHQLWWNCFEELMKSVTIRGAGSGTGR